MYQVLFFPENAQSNGENLWWTYCLKACTTGDKINNMTQRVCSLASGPGVLKVGDPAKYEPLST